MSHCILFLFVVLKSGTCIIRNSYLRNTTQNMNQSNVISDCNAHKVELYGPLLPVLVVEAISNESLSFQSLSVKISDHRWAWLVCGRRLFLWKYKDDMNRLASTCFELDLPPSDLSHKAELVTLILPNPAKYQERNTVGVLAVSPEGSLRYWPNVAYESHSIETSVSDLHGEECFMLTNINQTTCILGTTTSTLVSITISANESMAPVSFRRLRAPQGVLAGFSKRVSSFIFGSAPSAQTSHERTLIRIIAERSTDPDENVIDSIIVLAGTFIQKWLLHGKYEQGNQNVVSPQLQMFCVDFQFHSNKLYVLVVCGNPDLHAHFNFGLAVFQDQNSGVHSGPVHSPVNISLVSFHLLTNHPIDIRSTHEELLNNSHLIIGVSSELLYAYDHREVLCAHNRNFDVIDVIDFGGNEDGILGAGFDINGSVLMFTFRDALVTLIPNKEVLSMRNMSIPSINIQQPMDENDLNEPLEDENSEIPQADLAAVVGSSVGVNTKHNELGAVNPNGFDTSSTSNSSKIAYSETQKELRWYDLFENDRFAEASQFLLEISADETENISRKRTLLSLSKLAALASGETVDHIDEQLDDVLRQEKHL